MASPPGRSNESRGIDLTFVARDPHAQTGVYFKEPAPGARHPVSYYRAGSAASRLSPEDPAAWPLEQVDWLHTSGITASLSHSCHELVEYVLRQAPTLGYQTSFDVNYRPALLSRPQAAKRALRLGRLSNVVLDEADTLWRRPCRASKIPRTGARQATQTAALRYRHVVN